MGNRGNVVFASNDWAELSPAIYLHWNGGPESVYAFIEELDRRGIRADQCYEAARFTQIVGEFFDSDKISGLSLGLANVPAGNSLIERLESTSTDSGDNGFYVVSREGGLTVRRFTGYSKLEEMPGAKVLTEKVEADAHQYRAGMREFFEKATAGKMEGKIKA